MSPSGSLPALQSGDILLMLSRGELSRLIAWFGDCAYSHAALLVDADTLLEASAHGVRTFPLADRLADTAEVVFVDAFRPLAGDGSALSDDDRALVVAHARSLLGTPYPLDRLALLGLLVAVRGKMAEHWLARLVVREALDHVVRNDPRSMVCSEVVYRSFAENDARPSGRLAPRIVLEARGTEPFPKVDWKALWDEVWPLIHPQRQQALQHLALPAATNAAMPDARPALESLPTVDEDEMAAHLAAARAALGIEPPRVAANALSIPPIPLPAPNPKLVTPLDLASTPSHVALGRLMDASAAPVPA